MKKPPTRPVRAREQPLAPSPAPEPFPPAVEVLLRSWDSMRGACQNLECALPHQMTAAVSREVEAREIMDGAVREFMSFWMDLKLPPSRRDDITAPPPKEPE